MRAADYGYDMGKVPFDERRNMMPIDDGRSHTAEADDRRLHVTHPL